MVFATVAWRVVEQAIGETPGVDALPGWEGKKTPRLLSGSAEKLSSTECIRIGSAGARLLIPSADVIEPDLLASHALHQNIGLHKRAVKAIPIVPFFPLAP